MQKYHSGENCPKTGKYSEYDSNDKVYNKDIDVEKGQRFPPTHEANCYFKVQK